jgi:hypothetical protein
MPPAASSSKLTGGKPLLTSGSRGLMNITIFAPMIYAALFVIVLMRADTLHGEVGVGWGGLALEISISSANSTPHFPK